MASRNGQGAKAPRSRPAAPQQLPAQQHAITSFSPTSDHVAYLTQAIDRHRLQVYEVKASSAVASASTSAAATSTASTETHSRLLADYIIPNAQCESMAWVLVGETKKDALSNGVDAAAESSVSSKKRRKRQSLQEQEQNGAEEKGQPADAAARREVVALGLSSGAIHLYDPAQGKVLRILAQAGTSTASHIAPSIVSLSTHEMTIYGCSADGRVAAWDLSSALGASSPMARTWQLPASADETVPFQHIACLDEYLLCGHHAIRLVSKATGQVAARYPGHASSITHLVPLAGAASMRRFVSAAKEDRIMSIWQAPIEQQKAVPRPLATLALPAPARSISSFEDRNGRSMLLVTTVQGACNIFEIPPSLGQEKPNARKKAGVQVITKLAEVIVDQESVKARDSFVPILDATARNGIVRVARLAKLQKLIFESANLTQADGSYPEHILLLQKGVSQQRNGIVGDDETLGGIQDLQRTTGMAKTAHRRGATGEITGSDGMLATAHGEDGLGADEVDAQELEEPTLGQRLHTLQVGNGVQASRNGNTQDGSDDEDMAAPKAALPAGSLSLGETLTQALHSNDTAMLSSCLAHSDPIIIRSSVARLSGPLALRLLEHCVDRMGRGGKRSTGQLGSARTRGIIEWVRATLTAHTAYLMTLPHLVHRMAALHATLNSRLAAHERLLALNGRLELVLSQIELRAAYAAEQSVKVQGVKTKVGARPRNRKNQKGVQSGHNAQQSREWVEETSDDDDGDSDEDGPAMDVDSASESEGLDADVERGDEEGGIQEIALGNGTMASTSLDSDDAIMGDEDGDEESSDGDEELMDEDEASDESALDEEGDSDEVDDDEDDDDEEDDDDDDEDAERGTGLIDDEAESTEDDGEEEEEDEEEEEE